MAFEQFKENTEYIKEQTQSYVEHNMAFYKLKFFKIIMKSSVSVMKFVLVAISFIMVLFFSSLALAFALSIYFGSYALGFISVAGLYTILTLLLYLFKRKLIEGPFLKTCSKMFFNS